MKKKRHLFGQEMTDTDILIKYLTNDVCVNCEQVSNCSGKIYDSSLDGPVSYCRICLDQYLINNTPYKITIQEPSIVKFEYVYTQIPRTDKLEWRRWDND